MKEKLSITVEKETIELLEKLIEEGRFRNKSHALEYSLKKAIGGEND
jgi:Arc/MetJ-type ribon-helix-helix transcriptional regulator